MSPTTRTLELPVLDELLESDAPMHPAPADPHEGEPTTAAIPMLGGTEAVVLEEADPAERTLAELTLSSRRAKTALWVLAATTFAIGVNEAAIVALSPAIASGLNVPVAEVGLLVTAFALTVVVATVPLTLLTQRFAARTTLTATLAVWTIGVTVAATAESFGQLAAGRVISAAAHALFWAIVAPTAASLFAPHLRGMTVTRIMVGGSAVGVIGTPLITVAGNQIGWQAPFWAFAALGVLLTIALALALPGPPPKLIADEPDEDEPEPPFPDAASSGTHTRGDLPSLPLFIRVLAVGFAVQIGMSATWTYIVTYYVDVSGVGTSSVPLLFALGGVVGVGCTLAIGPVLARRPVHTVGLGLVGVTLSWILFASGERWGAVLGQVVVSAGWAILVAALLNWAMRHTPWRTDVGASVYMVTVNSGAALGPLLGAFVVAQWGARALPFVSLGLTIIAVVIVGTVDPKVVGRLAVPRSVRLALERREELRVRRDEWRRRAAQPARRPIGAAWFAGQNAARHAGKQARTLTSKRGQKPPKAPKPPKPAKRTKQAEPSARARPERKP